MISVLLTLVSAWATPPTSFAAPTDTVVLTDTGEAVRAMTAARSLQFTEAYTTSFRAEPAELSNAQLVVLSVDPDLARPRNAWTPVLYAGAAPAELLWTSPDATCVVALIAALDDVLFYGSTQLPERVTTERGLTELKTAVNAGHRSYTPAVTGTPLQLADGSALWPAVQDAQQFCP